MARLVRSPKCSVMVVCMAMVATVDQRSARACSLADNRYVFDPAEQAVDVQAPGIPMTRAVAVHRGRGPERNGCGISMSSCDGMGAINLMIQASDDRTPANAMGYRFAVVRGRAPDGLFAQGRDFRSYDATTVYLHWGDGATDDQEDLDFDLEVRALDRAGNVSAGAATITVRSEGGGCRVAGSRSRATTSAAVLLFALVALTAAARPRRRR